MNTKPLDGESDVKLRLAPRVIAPLVEKIRTPEDAAEVLPTALNGARVRCEPPNDKVNDVTAELRLVGHEATLVSEDNILLRGCMLRNTDWMLGLVLEVGPDTKVGFRGNSEPDGFKFGHSDRIINVHIMALCAPPPPHRRHHRVGQAHPTCSVYGRVALLFAICLTGASAHIGMLAALPADKQPWYLDAIKFIAHTNEARPIHQRVYSRRWHRHVTRRSDICRPSHSPTHR